MTEILKQRPVPDIMAALAANRAASGLTANPIIPGRQIMPVIVVIDRSGSTGRLLNGVADIQALQEALRALPATLPADKELLKICLVGFDTKPELVLDWISGDKFTCECIPELRAGGATSLGDAKIFAATLMYEFIQAQLAAGQDVGRGILIEITDGIPTDMAAPGLGDKSEEQMWNKSAAIMRYMNATPGKNQPLMETHVVILPNGQIPDETGRSGTDVLTEHASSYGYVHELSRNGREGISAFVNFAFQSIGTATQTGESLAEVISRSGNDDLRTVNADDVDLRATKAALEANPIALSLFEEDVE